MRNKTNYVEQARHIYSGTGSAFSPGEQQCQRETPTRYMCASHIGVASIYHHPPQNTHDAGAAAVAFFALALAVVVVKPVVIGRSLNGGGFVTMS